MSGGKMKLFLALMVILSLAACSSQKKQAIDTKDLPNDPAFAKSQTLKPEVPSSGDEHKDNKPSVDHTLWSYTGLTGPEMWGDLKEDYILCKIGKLQSPINLLWKRPMGEDKIEFNYKETGYNIIDNGHSIQIQFEPGNHILHNGHKYELVQLHFHAHSEHALSGKFFPLEAHFVHKDEAGQLAVLGVFFIEGKANPFLEVMWKHLPKVKNREIASTNAFDPSLLLPSLKTHYSYMGSLTTPPCSENVSWNVFNTPVEMSREQINHFKVLYSKNFRPLQPINDRPVSNY